MTISETKIYKVGPFDMDVHIYTKTLIYNLCSIFYQFQPHSDVGHEIYHQLNYLRSSNGQY